MPLSHSGGACWTPTRSGPATSRPGACGEARSIGYMGGRISRADDAGPASRGASRVPRASSGSGSGAQHARSRRLSVDRSEPTLDGFAWSPVPPYVETGPVRHGDGGPVRAIVGDLQADLDHRAADRRTGLEVINDHDHGSIRERAS